MSATHMIRVLAAVVLLATLAAACGQKPDVHLAGAGGAAGLGTGVGASEGAVGVDTDGDGQIDSYNGGDTTVAGGDTGGTGATGTTDTAGNPSTGNSSGDTSNQNNNGNTTQVQNNNTDDNKGSTAGGDSTGITDDTITIGVHAPLTGAAPIPQRSFFAGKDQYWNAIGKVYGRNVKVVFRDDKYNPSAASQACQELILREKVFILAGSGGTDQIAECARIAGRYGVPYLSAGVTRVGLDRLPNYFAQSMSYSDQIPLLMQWIKKNRAPANKRVGIIASNTANFDDAVAAFEEQAKKFGYTPHVYRPSKAPSEGELAGYANQMAADGITVGTPVMQPTAWIKLAKNTQLRGVHWAGIGVTMGLNSVANVVCPDAPDAMFFSPFPGYNLATTFDKRASVAEDDIQWAQWGSNKSLHEIFKRMDGNLTRQAFAQAMLGSINTGIFPPTEHSQSDHFRVKSVHVLKMDCGKRQFVSTKADLFRSSF
jgi:branched-chain amino acid transport system substrate-binding protein